MSPSPEPRPAARQAALDEAGVRALARTPMQAFWHGAFQSLPFLVVILPFAILFGVVAIEAGMDIAQVMGFSVLVLAGASQFTAVQLLSDNAPVWIVILSSLAVNLRMAMYSASLVPWLGSATPGQRAGLAYVLIDQTYALSVQHYEEHPRLSMSQRLGYFFGTALVLCLPWMIGTWIGATVGQAIPEEIALDFALPITFIAMIAPMLRTLAHLVACFVAVLAALLLTWMPSGTGLLIAAPLGMIAGALVETWTEKRSAA